MDDELTPAEPENDPPPRLSPAEALDASPPTDSASIGRRAMARLVDTILVVGLSVLIGLPFVEEGADGAAEVPVWLGIIGALLGATYEVGCLAWRGQTPGKIAMGIQVVTVPDGQIPTINDAVRRWIVPGMMLSLFGVLGLAGAVFIYLSAAVDRHSRGLHDKLARTRVVDLTKVDAAIDDEVDDPAEPVVEDRSDDDAT